MGKMRHFKASMANMAIVAKDQSDTTIVVANAVLFWFKNRFYRANQFAAAYSALGVADRFEVLSDANLTFTGNWP